MSNFTPRQQEIIQAAMELIAQKGIQQLTIKNLSKKIGVVEGAIYRHFDSKMDILLGILQLFRENKIVTLDEVEASGKSPLERLELLFVKRFAGFTQNPAITAVIFSEEIFQNDKRLASEVFTIMNDSQEIIKNILSKGQAEGQLRNDIPAEQLTLLITGALRLIVTRWRLSGFSFDLQSEGQKLWQTINKIVTN